ncbi:DUF6776 family protein [Candidatus Thiosymbion oneisti]|uniref:DUF6776 family protein n=1 Tax=Candidatus Thiosymbion oneisti TaxID=589554 RepID=UPI00105BFE2E|nr:DUF6776 family protein [Candidatus Thiosymbion oneisti]
MGQHRGIVTPKIVQPASSAARVAFVLLILVALAAVVIGAFFVGRQTGVGMLKPLGEYMRAAEGKCDECDALAAQVSDLKERNLFLKQLQQIDREVNRNLSKQIKEAQDERLTLEKEVSLLRRLVQEGGGGILQLKDFKVEAMGTPGEFRYSFTLRQLVQGFGESTGEIEVRVIGKRNGEGKDLSLDKLVGYDRLRHRMKFKHFQNVQGSVKVPDDFEPEKLIVEVKPETDKMNPVSEIFPWSLE